ncbi:MAG: LysR family transcriptional regulator [Planctomycetota bacterium]
MPSLPPYDLRDLVCFLAVVDRGSISGAAAELHLTQPAVSQRVNALEAGLGARLLVRTSKGVRPTAAGERVAEGVPAVLAALRGVEQEVRQASVADHVVLGSSDTAALYLLPDPILRFRREFPACRLTLINRESRELIKLCADGSLDLALVSLPHHPPRTLVTRIVKRSAFVAVGPRRHPLFEGDIVTRAALAHQPLVLLGKGTSTRTLIDRWLEGCAEPPRVVLESSNLEVIKRYVARGWGVTVLPAWAITTPDALAVASLRPEPPRMAIALVRSATKQLSAAARQLVEMLAAL